MSSIFSTARVTNIFGALFDRKQPDSQHSTKTDFVVLIKELLSSQSDAQQQSLSQAILDKYDVCDEPARHAFFDHLATDLDIDAKSLSDGVAGYRADPSAKAYRHVQNLCTPPRVEVFHQLANVQDGAARLVKMRQDIRAAMKTDSDFRKLDHDLHELLSSWFNRGFLVLQPITWKSPANILEKIIAYEAVHTIQDWDDLRRRLHPEDRRCYAFFHPRMPDDPIIFVEVALTQTIPNSIDAVLAEDREALPPATLTTATFYSISNCHPGLAGISFGNALIKQVAQDLSVELPHLETFVTLSPIPGLADWAKLSSPPQDVASAAAQYLCQEKRHDNLPLDPVARFHLGNGAKLHAIHAGANSSSQGAAQSFGAMVNYLYDLDQVETHADAFATSGRVAMSAAVKSLL
ncbi:MAG: malonyl-CoA decarboxylase domain-containing protein [Planktomarina sp.]